MKYATLMDRIIANSVIDPELSAFFGGTPCWIWIGKMVCKRDGRYGSINLWENSKHVTKGAHRISIIASGRRLGKKQLARHMCNNTWCVNPGHLRVGTSSQNRRDQLR